jgi:hypothetical protein
MQWSPTNEKLEGCLYYFFDFGQTSQGFVSGNIVSVFSHCDKQYVSVYYVVTKNISYRIKRKATVYYRIVIMEPLRGCGSIYRMGMSK